MSWMRDRLANREAEVKRLEQQLRGMIMAYDSVVESVVEFFGPLAEEWKDLNGLGDEEE